MFIQEGLNISNTYSCSKKFGMYLINKYNAPLLSINNGRYMFSYNKELEEALNSIPKVLKIFYRESGDIVG